MGIEVDYKCNLDRDTLKVAKADLNKDPKSYLTGFYWIKVSTMTNISPKDILLPSTTIYYCLLLLLLLLPTIILEDYKR